MVLREIIIDRIRNGGPISFRDFMETCLYYPGLGYYSAEKERIGRDGDFYTSPSLSPLFAEMISRQMEELWMLMGKKPFTIVEYGAGPGHLSRDILKALEKTPALYEGLRYCIIEQSPAMREKEKSILPEKVSWPDEIGDIPALCGCILSNELMDNFPVHQVVMDDDLMEVFVDYHDGFIELLRPASQDLKDYLDELHIGLPRGFRTEINLKMIPWIRDIAAALHQGFVITIDYGFSAAGLYQEKRKNGTLLCYHRHSANDNPYDRIGDQDITTHVNFSAISHWGFRFGLQELGFTSQLRFLQGLGLAAQLRKEKELPAAERQNLLGTFLMDMGTRLKVLIQQKGMNKVSLSGLQFAKRLY